MSYSLAFSQSLFMLLYVGDKVAQGHYEFIPTQQISDALTIPPSTAGMILRRLSGAGIVETREGANGGVRLARPPEAVTLLDIFMAIEQERPMFQTHVKMRVMGEKPTAAYQAIWEQLKAAEGAMKAQLKAVTVRDLMTAIDP